jgi:lysyl-tRNA synthetase class I
MSNINEIMGSEEQAISEIMEKDGVSEQKETTEENFRDEYDAFIRNCDDMMKTEGLSQEIKDKIADDKKRAEEDLKRLVEEAEKKASE